MTRVQQRIVAPALAVYAALLDADAVQQWMVPDGMTSHVHAFDAREGGAFRISLTYAAPTSAGKTSAQTDTFTGRFVHLDADRRVVQEVAFESADPELRGTMRITYLLEEDGGQTVVSGVHEGLPPGLSAEENELGWRMSMAKLAALVEAGEAGRPAR